MASKNIFPITEKISYSGVVREFSVYDGQKMTCIKCSKPFYANGKTAHRNRDGNTYLVCPHCEDVGSTFYYAQQRPGRIVAG